MHMTFMRIGLIGGIMLMAQIHPDAQAEPKPIPASKSGLEDLARALPDLKTFDPKPFIGRPIEFTAIIKIAREVPVIQFKELTGPFTQAHLFSLGSSNGLKVGEEIKLRGLIVDIGYGAWSIWVHHWEQPANRAAPVVPAKEQGDGLSKKPIQDKK